MEEENKVIETEEVIEEEIEDVEKQQEDELKQFMGVKAVAVVEKQFAYVDYHADCLLKIKDDTHVTNYSFVKKIGIINHTNLDYTDLVVKVSFSHEAFLMSDINISIIEEYEELFVKVPFLKVNKNLLDAVAEPIPATIKLDLYTKNDILISSEEYSFLVLPVSQPSYLINNDKRLYSKFVTPLEMNVKQLSLNARSIYGNDIIAYQNADRISMLKEAQSIYLALHEWGIAYQNPPAGGFNSQRIRMPEEVLRDKKGTCVDLAILFCACLEEVGYKSILVFIKGHVFAGFFLKEAINFPNGVEHQCSKVYNLSTGGMNDICLVECTAFTAANQISFQQAISLAIEKIKTYNRSFAAVDVNLCHSDKMVFSPIPTAGNDDKLDLLMDPERIGKEIIDDIVEKKYVEVLKDNNQDRFSIWERKLLDLTEANQLVSFKLNTKRSIKITSNIRLYDLLSANSSLKISCIPQDSKEISIEEEFKKGTLTPNEIFGSLYDDDRLLAVGHEKVLKTLIKKSNSAMDETGAPTLYLCLGRLTFTRKKGNRIGYAPFMVLPIKITKDKIQASYTMSYDYDDLMINQTFFEYYKQEHKDIDFSLLYQAGANYNYMDIVHTFKKISVGDIKLDENEYFIGNLTFANYIMWQDIRKRKNELKKNEVIQSILEDRNLLEDKVSTLDKSIDDMENYQDFAAPLSYDSTQLKAILKCGEGKSFILDGPPGTGKSQTIVNMIVNAFHHGKTVLFVAEKKAALDVVADRLRKLGDPNSEYNLGRFCLELHSNKASKSQFFGKLRTSMDLGMTKDADDFDAKCQELEEKKSIILSMINKMHEKKYYYSLYESIVTNGELDDYESPVDFSEEYLLSLDEDKLNKTHKLIDEYISSASHIDDFNFSPVKLLKTDKVNFYDKQSLASDFKRVKDSLDSFIISYNELTKDFTVKFDISDKNVYNVMQLLDICFNKNIYANTLSEYIANTNDTASFELFDTTEKLLKLKKETNDIFNFDLIDTIDAKKAIDELNSVQGFFKKLKTNSKYKKQLASITIKTHKIDKKNLVNYYTKIQEYNELDTKIKYSCLSTSKMIGMDYYDQMDNLIEIKNTYINSREFVNIIKELSKDNILEAMTLFVNIYMTKNPMIKMAYTLNDAKLKEYMKEEALLREKYKINVDAYRNSNSRYEQYLNLLIYCSNEDNFDDILDMSAINKISNELLDLGLGDFIDALITNKIEYNSFKEVYDLSLANGFIKLYFKDEDINYFNPLMFDSNVKKYKDLINEYNNLVIESVSAKLTRNLNHSIIDYANSSPIGRLKKTISSNGRGVTIRDTLLNYDEIIRKYFPCFLMSPLSAAQYLAVDEENGRAVSKFDVVIFDEASQIPTHKAVGPIARGNSLIVAGDPEQMPPSAYFNASVDLDEEELQYEDAVSLLDECIAIEIPRIRLSYHYRSKHESLISFSNHNFYNDSLYTFPSPNTANSFVEFNYVDLEENKKDSRITEEEIEAICSKFKSIYTNEETKNKSVGIVVFNITQQEKVFDAITEMLAEDKELNAVVEAACEKTKEHWFVKSLENVQGDERDIIILSIGFRKNSAGRAIVIGPIIKENGQRRLNVAVSRSKEKMIVISTIRYVDFDEESRIKNKGQLTLKRFLEYAEKNTFVAARGTEIGKSSIISLIKNDLEQKGYKVVANVGNSEFKVDLAIVHKNEKVYDLGILVDSKNLGENISCRDKFYVQDSVLNSLKWKIINIYSLEYFKNKKAAIDRIIAAIDAPYIEENNILHANIIKEDVAKFSYDSIPYERANDLQEINYDSDLGYDYEAVNLINRVIEVEGPVSFETIRSRVKENSNILNMSDKAKNRLKSILDSFMEQKTADQSQEFYWPKDSNKEIIQFRTDSKRDIYDIAKEEILAAMIQILDVQGKIIEEDLYKCTLIAFGCDSSILNKKNMNRLSYVYNWAKQTNRIRN